MAKRESSKPKAAPKATRGKRGPVDVGGPPVLSAMPVPISMAQVAGHEHAIAALRRAASSGRLHHAWIFRGPTGVGKLTTALAFAGWVLDPASIEGGGPDPDGETQRLLASGVHPGLHVITKESSRMSGEDRVRDQKQRTIPVEVVREFIVMPASLQSVMPGGLASKVFIIDEAELLNNYAQNALLKTLEEPPKGTLIILVTSRDEALLPTIRSRCQLATFTPLRDEELRAFARARGVEAGPQAIDAAARFQAGSPGILELAIRTGLTNWPAIVDPMLDSISRGEPPTTFGLKLSELVNEWAEALIAGQRDASKQAASHRGAGLLFALIASYHASRLRQAAAEGERAAASNAISCLEHLRVAEEQHAFNVHLMFVLDNFASQCALNVPAYA